MVGRMLWRGVADAVRPTKSLQKPGPKRTSCGYICISSAENTCQQIWHTEIPRYFRVVLKSGRPHTSSKSSVNVLPRYGTDPWHRMSKELIPSFNTCTFTVSSYISLWSLCMLFRRISEGPELVQLDSWGRHLAINVWERTMSKGPASTARAAGGRVSTEQTHILSRIHQKEPSMAFHTETG